MLIDLTKETDAYFIGFSQSDGNLSAGTRNRGKLGIEISKRDLNILEAFRDRFPTYTRLSERTRDTNFKKDYTASTLRICNKAFRDELVACGVPYGKKSGIVSPPSFPELNRIAYLRGLIDGDGSLGFTEKGIPFISFCTQSEDLKDYYAKFITEVAGGVPTSKRNKRDNIYNIILFSSRAQAVVSALYLNASISIHRKQVLADSIIAWERPEGYRKPSIKKFWGKEDDAYILNHSLEESMIHLGRTDSSIKVRIWRLTNK